jgi:hypothetical protein
MIPEKKVAARSVSMIQNLKRSAHSANGIRQPGSLAMTLDGHLENPIASSAETTVSDSSAK